MANTEADWYRANSSIPAFVRTNLITVPRDHDRFGK